jgi:hypothetical protein
VVLEHDLSRLVPDGGVGDAELLEKLAGILPRILLDVDRQEDDALIAILLIYGLQVARLLAARHAPGGEEVHHDPLAPQALQAQCSPAEPAGRKGRSPCALARGDANGFLGGGDGLELPETGRVRRRGALRSGARGSEVYDPPRRYEKTKHPEDEDHPPVHRRSTA